MTVCMQTRRKVISGLSGLLAAAMLHTELALARNASGTIARLRPGDTVGVIAPASPSYGLEQIEGIKATITGMGLVPKVGAHASDRYGYLAGTDQDRAADVQAMFADESVRAIFAIRGGWGCARLLPLLDWKLIAANPKLMIGSSDITAFHLAIAAKTDFASMHAPNSANRWDTLSWNSFWQMAFAGQTPLLAQPDTSGMDAALLPRWQIDTIRPGKASGRLLGGNLSVLTALVGTPWMPDFDGAILFLEDVGEAEYRIDRMLSQLALSGILGKLAGVIFGQCTRCSSELPDYAGFTIPQLLRQYFEPLGIPAFAGANIGHVSNQLSLPVGAQVSMNAKAGTIQLEQPIVT